VLLDCVIFFFYSYAEMAKDEKNKISHRSKALDMVKSHFVEAGYIFQDK
jgi:inosine triphosphate pyrophosphatase